MRLQTFLLGLLVAADSPAALPDFRPVFDVTGGRLVDTLDGRTLAIEVDALLVRVSPASAEGGAAVESPASVARVQAALCSPDVHLEDAGGRALALLPEMRHSPERGGAERFDGLYAVSSQGTRTRLSSGDSTPIWTLNVGARGRLVGYLSTAEFHIVDLGTMERRALPTYENRAERRHRLFPEEPWVLVRESLTTPDGHDVQFGSNRLYVLDFATGETVDLDVDVAGGILSIDSVQFGGRCLAAELTHPARSTVRVYTWGAPGQEPEAGIE